MKIIDILNKMANETLRDGFKFRFNNSTYTYYKCMKEIIDDSELERIGKRYNIDKILNDEVEVIREGKDIEEIDIDILKKSDDFTITTIEEICIDKINELVRKHNKLIEENEEREEK